MVDRCTLQIHPFICSAPSMAGAPRPSRSLAAIFPGRDGNLHHVKTTRALMDLLSSANEQGCSNTESESAAAFGGHSRVTLFWVTLKRKINNHAGHAATANQSAPFRGKLWPGFPVLYQHRLSGKLQFPVGQRPHQGRSTNSPRPSGPAALWPSVTLSLLIRRHVKPKRK